MECQDFSYDGATAPTGEGPQSKLWFNDGIWWGCLVEKATATRNIYKLDWATQTWSDTGVVCELRLTARTDALWDGSHLYIAGAGQNDKSSSDRAMVQRFSYNATSKTYTPDSGFPVTIATGGGIDAVVLAKDSTGMLWVTYTQTYTDDGMYIDPNSDPNNPVYRYYARVWVAHSTTDDSHWTNPVVLPSDTATKLWDEDISAVIAFDSNKIGIMWDDQTGGDVITAYYWAVHVDGAPDNQWNVTPAFQLQEAADNHINLKSLGGKVFAVVKTSLDMPDDALIVLLVLQSDGTWTSHPVFNKGTPHVEGEDPTRGIVLIDQTNRNLYVFVASPCCSGGTIYYKQTSMDSIQLVQAEHGAPFIHSDTDVNISNAASTKQNLDGDTNLVVIAGDDQKRFYLHNVIDLP